MNLNVYTVEFLRDIQVGMRELRKEGLSGSWHAPHSFMTSL